MYEVFTILEEAKVESLLVLDIRKLAYFTSFFLIGTILSPTHAHRLITTLTENGEIKKKILSIEGDDKSSWILIDFGYFILHLMDFSARDYYRLEYLWHGAPVVKLNKTLE